MGLRSAVRALTTTPERRSWNATTLAGMGLPTRGSLSRGNVTPDQALSLGAVYACLRFISDTVSCMAVDTVRSANGVSVPVRPPQIVSWPSPRAQISPASWLWQFVWALRARGNAFGLVTSWEGGWPARVDIIDPARVSFAHKDGVDRWWLADEHGRAAEVSLWQDGGILWHVPLGALPGNTIGMDVISAAAVDLGIAFAARQYAGDFYWSGGHPTAVLTTEQSITQEQATAHQKRWVDAIVGGGREPRVMGNGLRYQPLQVTPDQAQMLGALQASVADVCRWFGVPPEEIGGTSGDSLTYATVNGRGVQALKKLTPTIRTVQDAWSAMIPGDVVVRLVPETLLMTDAETKHRIIRDDVRAGVLTPNEGRKLLDLPAVDGGDKLAKPSPNPTAQEVPTNAGA